MYSNIGKKIKGLAFGTFIVATVSGVIAGIELMIGDYQLILTGFLTMLLSPLVAWISSWILYGFGELIDKACCIERNTRISAQAAMPSMFNPPARSEYTYEDQFAYENNTNSYKTIDLNPAVPQARPTNETNPAPKPAQEPNYELIDQIKQLHDRGLINEDEYRKAIAGALNGLSNR